MNAYSVIKEDLDNVIKKSLRFGIAQNPQIGGKFYSSSKKISSKYTFFKDEEEYLANYFKRYEQGEYLVALMDGSFFQINYEFNTRSRFKSEISKMNLCFLPNIENDKLIKEYIRIDFDADDSSFFHSMAHLHIGFKKDVRIPLDDIMVFSQFFQFILYLYYKDEYIIWNNSLSNSKKITQTKKVTEGDKLTKHSPLTEELSKFIYINVNI